MNGNDRRVAQQASPLIDLHKNGSEKEAPEFHGFNPQAPTNSPQRPPQRPPQLPHTLPQNVNTSPGQRDSSASSPPASWQFSPPETKSEARVRFEGQNSSVPPRGTLLNSSPSGQRAAFRAQNSPAKSISHDHSKSSPHPEWPAKPSEALTFQPSHKPKPRPDSGEQPELRLGSRREFTTSFAQKNASQSFLKPLALSQSPPQLSFSVRLSGDLQKSKSTPNLMLSAPSLPTTPTPSIGELKVSKQFSPTDILCRQIIEGNYPQFSRTLSELPKSAIAAMGTKGTQKLTESFSDISGQTPLYWAAFHDRPQMLVDLLNEGVGFDIASEPNGDTPLHVCTSGGFEECTVALLICGANQYKKNSVQLSPAQIAQNAIKGNLIPMYAAFHYQARPDARREFVTSFVDKGEWPNLKRLKAANIYLQSFTLEPQFQELYPDIPRTNNLAVQPSEQIVVSLVSSINQFKRGDSILFDQIIDLVSQLNKETVNLPGNEQGHCPLFAAAKIGLVEVVIKLLQIEGVDPNVSTLAGHTPLHVVSYEGYDEIVALLLLKGADMNRVNEYGNTPIHTARYDAAKVYNMLKQKGRAELIHIWPRLKELDYQFSQLDAQQKEEEFNILCSLSAVFQQRIPFPLQTNTIQALSFSAARKLQIASFASQSRIIAHYQLRKLILTFLDIKREHGTEKEQRVYRYMTIERFIERLISKRPLKFFGPTDITVLRDGSTVDGKDWNLVGKDEEGKISIQQYLTYDEMLISALIGVSSPTYFINNGERHNLGTPGPVPDYPFPGIYVGLVGARFEKKDKMESKYFLIQNQIQPTTPEEILLAKMWADFYECPFPTFSQVQETDPDNLKYPLVEVLFPSDSPVFFNVASYQKRMEFTIISFLTEANDRGSVAGKQVYCHIVGLGLGAWQVTPKQADWVLQVFENALRTYKFPFISDLDFSWFPGTQQFSVDHNGIFTSSFNPVKITFSKRNPSDCLVGINASKLLAAMYAWDSNSFPGNEYWTKHFSNSGDPAAVCCSLLQELQNPEINLNLLNNIFWANPERIDSGDPTNF